MGGWIIDSGVTTSSAASVHNNSGVLTYGGTLCPGTPDECDPYVRYSVKTNLEEDTMWFDAFETEFGKVSKAIDANGCNQESLVMWFNGENNTYYGNILNNNSIFDIKNIDECEHIIIVNTNDTNNTNNLRIGSQAFEDSGYTDSGYPSIAVDPCNSINGGKYTSDTRYNGHKIKYHTIRSTVPTRCLVYCNDLVELYFPHLYKNEEEGYNTKTIDYAAFSGNTRLSAITFSAVENIGDFAFARCNSLSKIDWGHIDCFDSNLKNIGERAFDGCNSLTCILLPESLESLGEYAFNGCYKAEKISIGHNLRDIPEGCFSGVGSSSSVGCDITISRYVSGISKYAFSSGGTLRIHASWACDNDTLVTDDSTQVSIDGECFSGCDSVTIYTSSVNVGCYRSYFNRIGITVTVESETSS